MIYCYRCGMDVHEKAVSCPSCSAPQRNGGRYGGLKYGSYNEVPWYRKNWFAIACFLIFVPALLIVVLTGPIYYERSDKLRKYSILSRFILIVYSGIATVVLFSYFSQSPLKAALMPGGPSWATVSLMAPDDLEVIDIPDNIRHRFIALRVGGGTRLTFGQYLTMAQARNDVKTIIKPSGGNYIVHHASSNEVDGDDSVYGLKFVPDDNNFVFLESTSIDGIEVAGSELEMNFVLLLSNLSS